MRDLRTRTLLLFLGVMTIALAAILTAVLAQTKIHANGRARAELGSGIRMLAEIYATRRAQSIVTATQLADDKKLRVAYRSGDTNAVARQLASRVSQDEAGFFLLLDAKGRLLASAGDDIPAANADQLFALSATGTSQIAQFEGQPFQVVIIPAMAGNKSYFVIGGFGIDAKLVERVRTLSGMRVNFRVANDVSAEAPAGFTKGAVQSVSVTLDESAGLRAYADLAVDKEYAYAGYYDLRKKVFAWAGAIAGLCAFLVSILMRRLVKSHMNLPLRALVNGFRRVREGDYNHELMLDQSPEFMALSRSFNDMQEKVAERESRIVHHAQYDTLTGLTNRSVISERLKLAVSKAQRSGMSVAAISIDLSRFNEINGTLGHETGDLVLKEVARRLASNTRVSDTVARIGGDEFFVILEDTEEKLAFHLAEFLASSLETPVFVNNHEVKLTLHAGLALYPQHCESAESLRRMANVALFTAKEEGTKVVMYAPGQDEKHLRELAIIHDLPNAIRNDELYLQFQPKIDITSQNVNYVEALVRWRHPQLGFIPPDEFIALLEKSGKISNLTEWVFKQAILQSREWEDRGYKLGIAINISANDLLDGGLPDRLNMLLRHYLVDPDQISIEVTESAVIKDPEHSVEVLNKFRDFGMKVALDDFGTGQTSLALLKQLPLSEIKIDKSFVQNLRADSGDAIIVKSIIDLGHNMGLVVTAEGVESNYCWNLLNSYECDLVQGYLVSAPLTADEMAEWFLRLQDRHINKLDYSFVQDMSA